MIVLRIIVGYLIIGAILACKNRKMIDEVHSELMEMTPIAKQKWFMITFAIVVMLILPVFETQYLIKDIIDKLEWMKFKREIRKDLIEAKKKLDTMQAKLDDKQ